MRDRLVRNTAFNAAGRFWEAAVNLVLAAYIVPRVGLAGWGLWSLISIFTGYVALFDFGIGSGFTRYIAEYAARDERGRMSAVVTTGLAAYVVFGVLLCAVIWPLVEPLLWLIAWLTPQSAGWQDPALVDEVRFLLRGGLVLFAFSNCIAPFTAIQTGLQRMGVTNVISFGASLLKIAVTVAFLEAGLGVRGLLYAQGVVLGAFSVAAVLVAFRLAPGLAVAPRHLSRDALGVLFQFGWRAQVARLSNLIAFQTDKLVVGVVFGQLGLVGVYRVGEELASKMRQLPVLLLSAIVPAAADLEARGDAARLRLLYVRSTKYVAAVTVPLTVFVAGASEPLIRAWMGDIPGLETAAWVNRIITLGYLANILPGAGTGIALGMGRPGLQMTAGLIEMTGNVTLTIALVLTMGFYGIPLGTALAMGLSCAWFLRAMRPLVDVGGWDLIRTTLLWPLVAALPGLACCLGASWWTAGTSGRATSAVAVLGAGVALAVSYAALLYCSPFFDAYDRDFARQYAAARFRLPARFTEGSP